MLVMLRRRSKRPARCTDTRRSREETRFDDRVDVRAGAHDLGDGSGEDAGRLAAVAELVGPATSMASA
jgi:hypothetical protein